MAIATFAAGCFWGVEAIFQQVPGVIQTRVGYTGGYAPNPTYQEVCTDQTGHAEAVEIEYNPSEITYNQLLDLFFSLHDPTQLNRQGPDEGTQYRSVIFYHTPEQRDVAESYLTTLSASERYQMPIVTSIELADEFFAAEDYHQSFYLKMGRRYGGIG